MRKWDPSSIVVSVAVCLGLIGLGGCASASSSRLDAARKAYDRGNYAQAYRDAQLAVRSSDQAVADEAAYIAGLSAYHMQDLSNAQRYLQAAARSNKQDIANDAQALLGMVYAQRGQYEPAVRTFLDAARRLKGQQRANAYYYAGVTQQKLGEWEDARKSLDQARRYSQDPDFQRMVTTALKTTGYTLQFGAFADQAKAYKMAQTLAPQTVQHGLESPHLVHATDAQGRELVLVQVGRFATYTSASSARGHFHAESPIVVPITSEK